MHKCEACGLGFSSETVLTAHLATCRHWTLRDKKRTARSVHADRQRTTSVSGNVEVKVGAKFKCPTCGKELCNKSQLNIHIKTVHAKIREFKCPACGEEFGLKSHLQQHIKSVHKKIRDYSCYHCEQKFARAAFLRRHIDEVHEKVKYPCGLCQYEATRASHLTRHRKLRHGEGSSLPCAFCPLMFSTSDYLKRHTKRKHQEVGIILSSGTFVSVGTVCVQRYLLFCIA